MCIMAIRMLVGVCMVCDVRRIVVLYRYIGVVLYPCFFSVRTVAKVNGYFALHHLWLASIARWSWLRWFCARGH